MHSIESIEIPPGYELKLPLTLADYLKIKAHITNVEINHFAWITCDIVKEMFWGEKKLPLLTPSPQQILTSTIVSREYVPVSANKFKIIHVQLYTNLQTGALFDGVYNVGLVLHFMPKHKRRGHEENEKDSKRHCACNNGRGGGILLQAPNGRSPQG
jgi:hypothetical protein